MEGDRRGVKESQREGGERGKREEGRQFKEANTKNK